MTLMQQEINSQPDVLEGLIDKSLPKVDALCDEIIERDIKLVYIAARGTSDHAAVYSKYILETYTGIPVAFAAPSIITVYDADINLKDALVVGISQSGKAEDVLSVVKHANSQGALTVCLTNYDDSPMAKEGKYHFSCMAGEEKSVAATKTFTAQMMIMALLVSRLSGRDDLLERLRMIPTRIRQFLNNCKIDTGLIEKLRDMNECFVLARGKNYAIALEGALKIQETCYVRAKAYATSDFYHGPLALLDEKIPVFLIAPLSRTSHDTREILKRISDYGIKTIAVTNDGEIEKMASDVIRIPDGIRGIDSPFVTAVAMQQFACMLSLAKGLDPDNPRNIKKVTITK